MSRIVRLVLVAAVTAAWVVHARVQDPVSYRIVTVDGTRSLAVHSSTGTTDIITLDAAARLFSLTVREDARAGGVVVQSGNDRVVLTAGEATVSAGGRLIALSAPVTRAGTTWLVPIDFLRALTPRIEVRRASRLVVVAPAVAPRVTPRFEPAAGGGRLVLAVDPATPARVTRDGAQISVRFQANALDLAALTDAPADMIASLRADGPSLLIATGAAVTGISIDEGRDPSRITIDLAGAAPAAPASPAAPPPVFDRTPGIRTVVLDPGHGGDDEGARSRGGTLEKHVTLAVAARVKALLEARLGVRVVLTREGDVSVPLDRRAALANNNKADLFISLHANSAPLPGLRGAQVLSLDATDYGRLDGAVSRPDVPAVAVPVVGGGTRLIDAVPWQFAQLPHAAASASLAARMAARLEGAGIRMHGRPTDVAPLRVLVGANMPAILIELGFLTSDDDARALVDANHVAALAEAIVAAVSDVRLGIPEVPREEDRP